MRLTNYLSIKEQNIWNMYLALYYVEHCCVLSDNCRAIYNYVPVEEYHVTL